MSKKELLDKLKKLKVARSNGPLFKTQKDCLNWANQVAPLLKKHNTDYYSGFMDGFQYITNPSFSADFLMNHLNRMTGLMEQAINDLEIDVDKNEDSSHVIKENPYVDISRIKELKKIKKSKFDLKRLICFCEEINKCHQNEARHAILLIVRSILDHVPPIFNCKNFKEVSNNYAGTESFKKSMLNLGNFSRNIADSFLHTKIRDKEVLPNFTQVNFSQTVDVLLAEIIRILT